MSLFMDVLYFTRDEQRERERDCTDDKYVYESDVYFADDLIAWYEFCYYNINCYCYQYDVFNG